jgi:hypothetical protein
MVAVTGEFSDWISNNPCYSTEGGLPFVVGKTYKRRDGVDVKIVEMNDRGDCVRGDDSLTDTSGWRYNRAGDLGRSTGTMHDKSDPRNLLPEFPPEMSAVPEGFFIAVSLLSANKPLYEKMLFAQLMAIDDQLTTLRYEASETKDWKRAYDVIFGAFLLDRVQMLAKVLNIDYTVTVRQTSDFAKMVRRFTWDFTDWLEDHRVFYA